MTLRPNQSIAITTALAVFSYTSMPQAVMAAEPHVVQLAELHQSVQASQAARAQNLRDVDRVLSLPQAQEALGKAKVNPNHVRAAIASLSDQEVDKLAQKARAAEQDVKGGFITGILALIGLVVVILIVVAVMNDDD
ncbi:MAG TPA: PA2779 family protein [Bryobacteraceae bacterium]|nr:PA2779 family protein [Bryobacteraceae bacterium]